MLTTERKLANMIEKHVDCAKSRYYGERERSRKLKEFLKKLDIRAVK